MTRRVLVGIHAYEQPLRLRATISALRRRWPEAELLVLADGPDAATLAEVERLGLGCWLSDEPQGGAVSFNQLLGHGQADVFVFLEGGALIGPGTPERLLAALQKGSTGLAGPSTNHSWNEQGCFGGARESEVEVTAAGAARRFGAETRSLAPLLSLGDFCYAVRREVVECVGGADEGYGLGPCWEMDYSARVQRAGFHGVWVCGAYVWRPEFSARRRAAEPRLLEASRRLYQDRLCALRLGGGRGDRYEPHCLGLDCEHFAPPALIQLRRSLRAGDREHRPRPVAVRPLPRPRPELSVSCVMPTRGRVELALQSVRYFQRQDYPDRELVIVDDGEDGLHERLPDDPRIVYLRSPAGESIGAKRNRGCAAASGALIAHWDDDDWFSSRRLSDQIAPILSGHADITGLVCRTVLELIQWRFWTWTPELHRKLFVGDVHGGTLVYRRELWSRCGGYPNSSLAEDAFLLRNALRRGARLLRLDGEGRYVYVRHESNSWSFVNGRHVDPRGWVPAGEPPLPAEDRAFYLARSSRRGSPATPVVSCLMPTYDRPEFVARAIEYFLGQDLVESELIVIDDGRTSVAPLLLTNERIRYLRLDGRHSIGAKRNRGIELARGDLLANWDDDDWYAPWRLSHQVMRLRESAADVCGLKTLLYLDPDSGRAWCYSPPPGMQRWVADGTLLFTRDFWRRNRFPDASMGIDCRMLWNSIPKRLEVLDRAEMFVGIMHRGNTSPKDTGHSVWTELDPGIIRAAMGDAYARYISSGAQEMGAPAALALPG